LRAHLLYLVPGLEQIELSQLNRVALRFGLCDPLAYIVRFEMRQREPITWIGQP